MPQFAKKNIDRMSEQRDFTNPAVRFVRIRGRVVPIYNKKRIGELTSKGAGHVAGAGAILATAGVFKRQVGKGITFSANKLNQSPVIAFLKSRKSKEAVNTAGYALKKTTKAAKVLRAASLPFRFAGKHPLKIGLGLLGIGLLGKTYGTELQTESALGYDILEEE